MPPRILSIEESDVRIVHKVVLGETMAEIDTLRHDADGMISFERRSVVVDARMGTDKGLLSAIGQASPQSSAFSDGVRAFGLEDPANVQFLAERGILMDSEILGLLKGLRSYDRSVYDFYRAPGERGVVRRQMASSYPYFAGEIARKIRLKLATDQKASPLAAFGTAYGLKEDGQPLIGKGLLKRFAGRSFGDGGIPVQTTIEALGATQVDWFPRDEREWDWFLVVVEGVHRTLCPATGLSFGDLVAASKGKWEEFVRRSVKAADNLVVPVDPDGRPQAGWSPSDREVKEAFQQACEETVGMIRSCRNLLVLPVAGRSAADRNPLLDIAKAYGADQVASDMLIGGKSLVGAFETHRAYVHQAAHVETAIKETDGETTKLCKVEVAADGWAPVCDQMTAPNGLVLVPLTDPRQLLDEGRGWGGGGYGGENDINADGTRGLNLCVGHYYMQGAKAGTDHMVSVRRVGPDGSFERLSLARFHILGDFQGLDMKEHKRYQNAAVPADSPEGEAMAWFETGVREGAIPLNRDGVLSYTTARKKISETIEAYCDYDWEEPGRVEVAVEAWRPFLQKPYADFSFEELLSCPPVESLAEEMAPSFGKYALAV